MVALTAIRDRDDEVRELHRQLQAARRMLSMARKERDEWRAECRKLAGEMFSRSTPADED